VWIGSERKQTNPFLGIACCVGHRSLHGHPVEADQAITVHEARRMHTLNAAVALGEESNRGSVEPGRHADLIIVDPSPLATGDDDLASIRVDEDVLAGKPVHGMAPSQPVGPGTFEP
jgi:predicted amidohydrolase YtcJ